MTSGNEYDQTQRLKERFARIRSERKPLYLTAHEFDEILRWKLSGQYQRQAEKRRVNTEDVIKIVTGTALSKTHPDEDYETELRLGILSCIRGVGVPKASAVLALVFREKYAVIDFRGWRQIFDEDKTTFSISDYKRYLQEIKRLAG